jgi:hypothetical protein
MPCVVFGARLLAQSFYLISRTIQPFLNDPQRRCLDSIQRAFQRKSLGMRLRVISVDLVCVEESA